MECAHRGELDLFAREVIGAGMEVLNHLGAGFLEKVYERALAHELTTQRVDVLTQADLPVSYKGYPVGTYSVDMLVENRLIVELKCATSINDEHVAQCLNYLTASNLKIGLVLNFQAPRLQWRRVVRGL